MDGTSHRYIMKDRNENAQTGERSGHKSEDPTPGSLIRFLSTRQDCEYKTLGTWNGVMMPTCENMWGVIIFLRFYYIVGQAGIIMSLVLVFLCFLLSLLTSISLSAIATSGASLERGGPYYMTSRSLGPYLGASIGLVYYMGLILLGVLEVLGAVEVFHNSSSTNFTFSHQVEGIAMELLMGIVILLAPKMVKKVGMVFFTIVVATMIMFYVALFLAPYDTDSEGLTGLSSENFEENMLPDYDDGVHFGTILAIFFPCFACIFSGSHRGKDLKNPTTNIPRGTLAAVILSYVIYSSYLVLWGGVAHREYLKGNFDYFEGRMLGAGNDGGQVVKDISVGPHYVLEIGIIIASLSMALQCFIVAYKLLKDVLQDNVVPGLHILARYKLHEEPILALVLSICVAVLFGMSGSVDLVAPILTMSFLLMYAMVNSACFLMCIIMSPSWKPPGIRRARWRFAYRLCSGSGALMSIAFMFIISWYWALAVLAFAVLLYVYIAFKGYQTEWGSAIQGLKIQLSLGILHNLQKEKFYTLNWRPQLLCYYHISEDAHYSLNELVGIVGQLGKGRGLVVVLGLIDGNPEDPPEMQTQLDMKNKLIHDLKPHDLKVFPKVIVTDNTVAAVNYSWMSVGLGGLTPNTLLVNMPTDPDPEEISEFCQIVKLSFQRNKAVMVVKDLPFFPHQEVQSGNLDIWWIVHDGGLLIYLSYLLSQHRIWRKCNKRVFIVGEDMNCKEELEKNIKYFFNENLRMKVETHIMEMPSDDIGPYTIDWTFRVRNREKLGEILHHAPIVPNVINQGEHHAHHDRKEMFNNISRGNSVYIEKYNRLNQTMLQKSRNSPLVLITLPEPSYENKIEDYNQYYQYLLTLSQDLPRVIFMLGVGTELISKT